MARSGALSTPEEKGGDTVDRRPPSFSVDELVAEISGQLNNTVEGMTTRELCDAVGLLPTQVNMSRVSQKMRDMIILGQAEYAGKKQSKAVDGSYRSVPAWRLKRGGEGD